MNILGDIARVVGGIVALVLFIGLAVLLAKIGLNIFLTIIVVIAFAVFVIGTVGRMFW